MKKRLSFLFVLALTFIFNVAGMESGSRIIKDYGSGGRFIISVSEDRTTITGTYIKSTGTGAISTVVKKQTGGNLKKEEITCILWEIRGGFSSPMIISPEPAIVVELQRLILETEGKQD